MNKEQIEQAAENEVNSYYYYGEYPFEVSDIKSDARHMFCAGAEWRINSVWHDVKNEIPKCNKHVVNEDWFDFEAKDEKDLKRILKNYPFRRWAYVEDLLYTETV